MKTLCGKEESAHSLFATVFLKSSAAEASESVSYLWEGLIQIDNKLRFNDVKYCDSKQIQ